MNENRCLMCGEIIPEGMQVCTKCAFQTQKEFDETGKAKLKTDTLYEKLTAMTPWELAMFIHNVKVHCLLDQCEYCPLFTGKYPCNENTILAKMVRGK